MHSTVLHLALAVINEGVLGEITIVNGIIKVKVAY
jgi:hypothetical protein